MSNIIQKIKVAVNNKTTYRIGLLQAKAYRILKQETAKVLMPYDISTIEWAFLGLLFVYREMRPKIAAKELGVEPPFITTIFRHLQEKGLVIESPDPTDSRAKVISLSLKGRKFVEDTEPIVLGKMRALIQGVGKYDILNYMIVLEGIIKNAKRLNDIEEARQE